jgi:hypothetical protein
MAPSLSGIRLSSLTKTKMAPPKKKAPAAKASLRKSEAPTLKYKPQKPTKSPKTVPGGRKPRKPSRGQGRP